MTQQAAIYTDLKKGRKVTSMTAFDRHKITRLSDVILKLRRQYNRPEHEAIPALPMPTVSQEQARANLAKIKGLINGSLKEMP